MPITKRARTAVYLAGRMDPNDPMDAKWRKDLTPFLENLGFEVLDPYFFEPDQLAGLKAGRLPKGYKHWTELRDASEPHLVERFLRYMRRIIKFDIKTVKNDADYLIVRWSEGCKSGAGTHAEITIAFDIGKPVYVVEEAKMPSWARACAEKVFKNFDELRAFMTDEFGVNGGE